MIRSAIKLTIYIKQTVTILILERPHSNVEEGMMP